MDKTKGVIASDSSYNKVRDEKQCRTIFTNYPTKQIIDLEFSLFMDPFNHSRGLESIISSMIQNKRSEIVEIITDECKMVKKVLTEKYSAIHHSLDIWYKANSLVKSFRYEFPSLAKYVKKYFWSCCETCDGESSKLLTMWKNIFRIIRNDHSQCLNVRAPCLCWKTRYYSSFDLNEASIKSVCAVLNQNNVRQLKNLGFTSEIESFNHTLLTYCPKLSYYSKIWIMRIQIAMLRWNGRKGINDIEQVYYNILVEYIRTFYVM
jgi:hypothetical protein